MQVFNFFFFFLSLHHLKDGLEYISVSCLPLFISVVIKLFVSKKKNWVGVGHASPKLHQWIQKSRLKRL